MQQHQTLNRLRVAREVAVVALAIAQRQHGRCRQEDGPAVHGKRTSGGRLSTASYFCLASASAQREKLTIAAVSRTPDPVSLPPTVDGVGASRVRLPPGDWPLLLDFLSQRFASIPRAVWQARMQAGRVQDSDGQPLDASAPYRAGRLIHYYRDLAHETPIPFEATILYRDAQLLVADKPHFLPTIPSGRFLRETLLVRLKRQTGLDDLIPLHRLDRETAGLVLFSVNPATRHTYSALFAERRIEKHYEALAPTCTALALPRVHRSRLVEAAPFFRMTEADGEPNSETRIERIETLGAISRYRLTPLTGRKHQLRVHMAALGLPIVNDRWYPVLCDDGIDDHSRPLKLLARSLAFIDPLSGEARRFNSQLRL